MTRAGSAGLPEGLQRAADRPQLLERFRALSLRTLHTCPGSEVCVPFSSVCSIG